MLRRQFLASLLALAALSPVAYAAQPTLTIGIYPGTGKADIPTEDFRAAAMPFASALGNAVGREAKLVLFRSIKNMTRSMDKGRMDVYFVPPSLAVSAIDINYSPVARVRDQATGILVRRKGSNVETVALTEKESWLDVMSRYTLKRNKLDASLTFLNLKTQDDVAWAIERGVAQAGSLRSKAANELLAKGEYETWHPLPTTPDFTLLVSDQLSADDQDKLGLAATQLSAEAIKSLQGTIHSKVTGFVVDKQADYKIIKQAIKDVGY